MADPRAPGSLPPDVAERVRTYLAALLPPGEVDEAVVEVAADSGYWGDTDEGQILAVAHAVLTSRLRVAPEVEVLVLNEDVGLSVPEIAGVLGLPPADVRRVLDEALAAIAGADTTDERDDRPAVDAPPRAGEPRAGETAPEAGEPLPDPAAVGTEPPGRRRRRVALVASALVVAVVAIVAAWVVGRSDDCAPSATVCVTASVLTDAVDTTTGAPGPDRDTFSLDEDVTLWFAFERNVPDPGSLEVRWYRDAVPLYTTDVRLGAGDELSVSLVALWADQAGRYRVEVVETERVLLTRDFRIRG